MPDLAAAFVYPAVLTLSLVLVNLFVAVFLAAFDVDEAVAAAEDTSTRKSALVADTPEVRRKGWQRIALFGNFFMPGSLVTLDSNGQLVSLNLHNNRYTALRRKGIRAIAIAFSPLRRSELFVSLADGDIECIDIATKATVGTLRGHLHAHTPSPTSSNSSDRHLATSVPTFLQGINVAVHIGTDIYRHRYRHSQKCR